MDHPGSAEFSSEVHGIGCHVATSIAGIMVEELTVSQVNVEGSDGARACAAACQQATERIDCSGFKAVKVPNILRTSSELARPPRPGLKEEKDNEMKVFLLHRLK